MIHLLGIRHHGPGSARSLLQTLQALQPDCLLVEGPADAEPALPYIGHEGLLPPVALLIYNPKNPDQAAYLPFASFSPEWQALRYATQNHVPVRFIDLPQGIQFGLGKEEVDSLQLNMNFAPPSSSKDALLIKDPLHYLAQLAGYQDSERWWEVTFEQWSGEQIFPAIVEMMNELRQSAPPPEAEELLREAHMRRAIRLAVKDGFQQIAVVCGAWHTPALQVAHYKNNEDNKCLRGLKKVKTAATWIPWSYDRLSVSSGYRAGVLSPAYYELLFRDQPSTVIYWMTEVARLFRKEDFDASSAHIIEAVRLANMLAGMRGLQIAGIDELREAAISVFCEGYSEKMALIDQQLIIGNKIGQVPVEIPTIPLQRDLERCIKSARLSKERKAVEVVEKDLDLRVASNLLASHLLHRLNLLDIQWGWQKQVRKYGLAGTFHEIWKLKWKPEFAIQLIEAGIWGNTVKEAASRKVISQMYKSQKLPGLTKLIEPVLQADLSEAIAPMMQELQQLSATTQDVQHLMDALPPLVKAMRYGSSRQMSVEVLEQVVQAMVPRITIGLPMACISLNEAASEAVFDKIQATHHALHLLDNEQCKHAWYTALLQLADQLRAHALLRGLCTRLLFDKEVLPLPACSQRMAFALSNGQKLMDVASWLEGFLHGSGLLLIHHPGLWQLLDDWIDQVPIDSFHEVLPLLRRSFAHFSGPEREKILNLARKGSKKIDAQQDRWPIDSKRAQAVLPVVKQLLGLE